MPSLVQTQEGMLRAGDGGTEPLENLEKLNRDPTEASFQITSRIKGGKFTENVPKPLRSQTPIKKTRGRGWSSSPALCLQTERLAAQARGTPILGVFAKESGES